MASQQTIPFRTTNGIALSPWARDAMPTAELVGLEERVAEMGVLVSTVKRARNEWMVRVRRGERSVSLVGHGQIAAVIAGALDDFEETHDGPYACDDRPDDDDPGPSRLDREGLPEFNGAWAPDEILTVASQSGMKVRRA